MNESFSIPILSACVSVCVRSGATLSKKLNVTIIIWRPLCDSAKVIVRRTIFHQLSNKLWFVLSTSYMIAIYCTSRWIFRRWFLLTHRHSCRMWPKVWMQGFVCMSGTSHNVCPVIRLNNINDAPQCNGTFEKGDCCLCVYLVYVRARLSLSLSLSVYLFSLSYRSFFMVILLHLPNIRLLHRITKDEKWQWIFHMASDERTCVYVCLLNVRVSHSFVECHFVGNMYLMFQNMSQWPLFTFLFNSCTVRWKKNGECTLHPM